jgi:hypothetical protein
MDVASRPSESLVWSPVMITGVDAATAGADGYRGAHQ